MKDKYITYGLISLISTNAVAGPVTQAIDFDESKKRLFGKPGSVTEELSAPSNKLRLSMAKSDLPKELWSEIENLSGAWRVLELGIQSQDEHARMLELAGLSSASVKKLADSHEYQVLSAMSSPRLQTMARKGDYEGLLWELSALELVDINSGNHLSHKLEKYLREDEYARAQLQELFADTVSEQNKITRLKSLIGPGNVTPMCSVGLGLCVVVVAVVAATYVGVGVNVGVGLNVGAWISIAVNMAVTVNSGPHGDNSDCNACHLEGIPASIGRLENTMNTNLSIFQQFAQITNSAALHTKALVEYKKSEARAIVQAAERLGMIQIKEEDRSTAMAELDKFVEESLLIR